MLSSFNQATPLLLSRLGRVGLPLLTALLLTACGSGGEEKTAEKAEAATEKSDADAPADVVRLSAPEQQAAGLALGHLEERPLGTGLAVSGTLDVPPESALAVAAPLGGFVESTSLLQGSRVRKGEVLAIIRNPEFVQLQQDYLEATSRLRYAQADLDRQRELYQQEVAPQKNFQRAQAEYDALRTQTQAQAARLRLAGLPVGGKLVSTTAVRAPRSGFVRAVNVTVGQSVTAADALFELVDPTHLHVELSVFEKDVPRIQAGQLIRFALPSDSAAGRERTARVYLISRAINGPDRTVRVHGHLDQENDPALLPGLYVRATIETGRNTVPTLPDAAIVRYAGQTYGFIPASPAGSYRMIALPTGRSEDGYTEVKRSANLPATTAFVVKGAYSLLAKLKNTADED
jgi:cobalt-zinc-cadmium efflux system membrane fusion protein